MDTFTTHFPHIKSLLEGYSGVFRTNIQPFHYQRHTANTPDYTYHVEDLYVRECLLEHVGMLPVLATYFHPHIEEDVDLGRTLELLAVHDIGELIVGDKNVFTGSTDAEETAELESALKLLTPRQKSTYMEFKNLETNEVKFAKSIDKIGPDIYDFLSDINANGIRLRHYAGVEPHEIPDLIRKHKSPYMQWSTFMSNFHYGLIKKLEESYSG